MKKPTNADDVLYALHKLHQYLELLNALRRPVIPGRAPLSVTMPMMVDGVRTRAGNLFMLANKYVDRRTRAEFKKALAHEDGDALCNAIEKVIPDAIKPGKLRLSQFGPFAPATRQAVDRWMKEGSKTLSNRKHQSTHKKISPVTQS